MLLFFSSFFFLGTRATITTVSQLCEHLFSAHLGPQHAARQWLLITASLLPAQEGRLNASKTLSHAKQPFWVSVRGVSNVVMDKGVFLLGKALHHVK